MRKFLLFGLLLLLLAGCTQTQLTPPEELNAQGKASWYYNDATAVFTSNDGPCISTRVFVNAFEAKDLDTPGPWTSYAYVSIWKFDRCEGEDGEYMMWALGEVDLADAKFKARPNPALQATIEVDDLISGRSFSVAVDVKWRKGEVSRTKASQKDPSLKTKSRTISTYDAEASGSVSVGGVNLIRGLVGTGSYSLDSGTLKRRSPPEIYRFGSFIDTISAGQFINLCWSVLGTDQMRLTIDQGVGDVSGRVCVTVSPTTTTTYTLTARDQRGTSTAQFTVYILEPDEFEPNNTPETATPITLDFSSPRLTILSTDVDWFGFELTELSTVVADIDARVLGSLLDSVMGLFDADGNQIAFNDDFDGLDSHLSRVLGPGTYYLAVSGYPDYGLDGNHDRTGFYYLSVTATLPPQPDEFEPNDTPDDATVIEDFPFSNPHLTLLPNDVDWFTFDVTEAAEFFAYADTGTDELMLLGLFRQAGEEVELIDWSHWGLWAQLEPGTYYLALSGYDDYDFTGDHSQANSYSLNITLTTP